MTAVERTVRLRECKGGCGVTVGDPLRWEDPWPRGYCSLDCYRTSKQRLTAKPRATLRQSTQSAKRKPVAVASPEQRVKRRGQASIVSGATEGLQAAHLWPRDLGGCTSELCTVSLTAHEHRRFDDPLDSFDLLPYLIAAKCGREIAHAVEHAGGDLISVLERLTGHRVVLQAKENR